MNIGQLYGTGYQCLIVGISAVILAQVLKFFVHLIWKRKVDLRLFTTTGGMPSSHAAGVMGLSTTVGILCGFNSIEFSMAFGYALVVMYDAAGVRRAAGKQAACLNRIIMDIYKQELKEAGGKLKELLGHTPMQVIMGALLGVVYAYYMNIYFASFVK